MSTFQLHPQLSADTHPLGFMGTAHLRLHRNASLHWFLLVPETTQADFLDLEPAVRVELLDHCASLSACLKSRLGYPKVNFAAIGNVVPQLHLHVVGRRPQDPAWPAPVWGNLAPWPAYTDEDMDALATLLSDACGVLRPAPPAA